ncbi:ATP-dependent RNA helicase RhlB [Gammaproteobacteria bacterium]
MSNNYLTNKNFLDLGLPDELIGGLNELGFSNCTPIQADALPFVLAGRDIAGQAQTGTGKTIAFLLAVFTRLLRYPPVEAHPYPRALIMAPTRELAIQIHKDAEELGRYTNLRLGLAYGGTGYDSQRTMLKDGVDILIGTPGRLIDYYKQRIFDLKGIQVMVLDEADRMFDLGFIADVRFIMRRMPPATHRLNMLFSATLPWRVYELAYEHMNDVHLIQITPDCKTVQQVRQCVYYTANDEKFPLLMGMLRNMDPRRSIIFVNTKAEAEKLRSHLVANHIRAAVLSGDVPQIKRMKLLDQFQHGDLPVLVATDVAARGLHIPDVSHIFNYDLPQDPEDYVHRIGRTARAGASGDAISFACERYSFFLPEIESFLNYKIPSEDLTTDLLVTTVALPKETSYTPSSFIRKSSKGRGRSSGSPDAREKHPALAVGRKAGGFQN